MSSLKLILYRDSGTPDLSIDCGLRVFDRRSFEVIQHVLRLQVLGHHSHRKYYLYGFYTDEFGELSEIKLRYLDLRKCFVMVDKMAFSASGPARSFILSKWDDNVDLADLVVYLLGLIK